MASATSEDRFEAFWPKVRAFPPLAPWLGVSVSRTAARLAFASDDALSSCPCGPVYSGRLVRFIAELRDRSPFEPVRVPRGGRPRLVAKSGPPCGCEREPAQAVDPSAPPSAPGGCGCEPSAAQPARVAVAPRVSVLGPTAAVSALARWASVDRAQAEVAIGSLLRISGTRALTDVFQEADLRGAMSGSPFGDSGAPVLWSRQRWAPPIAEPTFQDVVIDTGRRIYVVLPEGATWDSAYGDPYAHGIDWVLAPYARDKGRWASFEDQVRPLFDPRHLSWPTVAAADIRYPRWKAGTPFLQRFVEHALNVVYAYRDDLSSTWPVGAGTGEAAKEYCKDAARDIERVFDDADPIVRVYDESSRGGCHDPPPLPDMFRGSFVFRETAGAVATEIRSIRINYKPGGGPLACHRVRGLANYISFTRQPMLALAYAFDECVSLGNICYQFAFDPAAAHGGAPVGLRERLYLLGMAQRLGSGALGALAEASHAFLHELIHKTCRVNHCEASCAPNGLAARWHATRMAHWGAVWCPVLPVRDVAFGEFGPGDVEDGLIDLNADFGPRTLRSRCGDTKKNSSDYRLGVTIEGYGMPEGSASFCCESFGDGNGCLRSAGTMAVLDQCTAVDTDVSVVPCSS